MSMNTGSSSRTGGMLRHVRRRYRVPGDRACQEKSESARNWYRSTSGKYSTLVWTNCRQDRERKVLPPTEAIFRLENFSR
jgi:hypothetical protein